MANKQLRELFLEDFNDRVKRILDMRIIRKRDVERRKKLQIIISKKLKLSGLDLYRIAFLFHHSELFSDRKKAKAYVLKSIRKGNNKAKWLYAAIVDRDLILQGKKQKFGTQYEKHRGKIRLKPWDEKTTDEERAKYNIPPIQEILDEIPHLTPWWKQKSKKVVSKVNLKDINERKKLNSRKKEELSS